MFKVGQRIYGIRTTLDDCCGMLEIYGHIFLAECNEYIICYSNYSYHDDDDNNPDESLKAMYQDSMCNNGEVPFIMFRKDLCFETKEEAKEKLTKLIENFGSESVRL